MNVCKSYRSIIVGGFFVHHVRSPLSVVMTENTKGVVLFQLCYTHVQGMTALLWPLFLHFWLQPAQIIPVVIIRGHEDVLCAETQSDE